jgi:phosphinothricin acetyltransferase
MMEIRPARAGDLPDIMEIYNDAVLNTTATFDIEEKTPDEMEAWLESHSGMHPAIVCLVGGEVSGYASLNEYSPKKAYEATAEVSVYIAPGMRGKGCGKALLASIIEEGARRGVRAMIARISEGNEISVRLFERYGFFRIGRLKAVGRKFGRLLDVDLYEKIVEDKGGNE